MQKGFLFVKTFPTKGINNSCFTEENMLNGRVNTFDSFSFSLGYQAIICTTGTYWVSNISQHVTSRDGRWIGGVQRQSSTTVHVVSMIANSTWWKLYRATPLKKSTPWTLLNAMENSTQEDCFFPFLWDPNAICLTYLLTCLLWILWRIWEGNQILKNRHWALSYHEVFFWFKSNSLGWHFFTNAILV